MGLWGVSRGPIKTGMFPFNPSRCAGGTVVSLKAGAEGPPRGGEGRWESLSAGARLGQVLPLDYEPILQVGMAKDSSRWGWGEGGVGELLGDGRGHRGVGA